ncbi:acyl-CoA dehydrogenase family protein [Shimia thalassica]|uniref:acyl-CoA dehydrogenase family protein n=1 Tax=Shimia thalassica TaxID=1715693 RepID=UPI002493E286|nr:acyl-CoA dehydrogenase family protein [Shimia thalassica]MDO6520820.1 acyl-CoA dehydrogenase family protein [Shimia thalassica]MDP2581452.1 acyl-CoA dehydrogenase family protein [Shimia thalassica]
MTHHLWMEEEHHAFGDSVRRFLEDEFQPNRDQWKKDGLVPKDFWKKAGEIGILGATIPEEHGGLGLSRHFDAVSFLEQAKIGDSGWGFSVHNIATHYITAFGTEQQKAKWLPDLASGEKVAAIAMTEPGTGSDLQAVKTSAVKDGNNYLINGSKTFITNGGSADLIVLVAKTDPSSRSKGVSLIMIETEGLEGFAVGRRLDKMGMKRNDTAELSFQDVRVPQTNLLGLEEGQGFYQLMRQLPWERLILAYSALGAAQCALDTTLDYVRERKAFGQRIMDFQNTRFKLAEAATKIEILAAFVDQCLAELDQGKLTAEKAAMAKWWSTDVQCEIVDNCLQLHGGYGYMNEYLISELYTDARVQKIYGGTNEIMKELIARSLDVD